MKIICFDMDGVICEIDHDDYARRSPNMETIKMMSLLTEKKVKIIIHTGRHINNLDTTLDWLKRFGVKYDHLQFGKPVADLYIDDKGMRFTKCQNEIIKLLL